MAAAVCGMAARALRKADDLRVPSSSEQLRARLREPQELAVTLRNAPFQRQVGIYLATA